MNSLRSAFFLHIFIASMISTRGADFDQAAKATNHLGVELYRKLPTDGNLCLSPYSLGCALAMTFAGADGETRKEMARVLQFAADGDANDAAFAALRHSLEEMAEKTARIAQNSKKTGGPSEPITLAMANRLFAQTGYDFRDSFRTLVKQYYGAPFEPVDFRTNSEGARNYINKWVAEQTRNRITDLIAAGGLNEAIRLVLANAIYLKAPWASEFNSAFTKLSPFHVRGGAPVDVATMNRRGHFGYVRRDGFSAIALSYTGGELQFLVLMPDEVNGLRTLESKLNAEMLAQCAKLKQQELDLYLPKFKFEPPTIVLSKTLQSLGMKSAFDQPRGTANFDKMAPRRPNDYLAFSEVFHKTFIAVDEKGTEAAAATAVSMVQVTAMPKQSEPIEVRVDRPFIYAIQHVASGTCLFLGRVTDPR
jgi:serpin B